MTKAPGLSPAEVERLVTYPIELLLTGVPALTEMRSLTKVGLPLITIVFDDSMDINLARQLVLERLLEVEEELPPGAKPMLIPNSTGLGEVFQYYLEAPRGASANTEAEHESLIVQRTIQDWIIRPLLKSTPEVIDVNSMGGFVKQYQVLVEPGMLRKYNLTLGDVFDAVSRNNANAGGNILEKHNEKPSPDIVEMYLTVGEAKKLAATTLCNEISGSDLHQKIVHFMSERGYESNSQGFMHNLGHGLGLDVQEKPVLGPGGDLLNPGNVITLEPGLYNRDIGGVRLEDMGCVVEGGFEQFTRYEERLVV